MFEEDRNLVRLAAFEYEYEAMLLRTRLNENGIKAWVTGGDGVNTFGAGLTAAGLVGVDVNVRQIDHELAKKVLSDFKSGDDVIAPITPWTCSCGEQVDEGFAVCWSCGNEFETEAESN